MRRRSWSILAACVAWFAAALAAAAEPRLYTETLSLDVPHIASDSTVRYDYDIVYVRAPRHGDERNGIWAEVLDPTRMEPGSDLMLLHPDGSEELLVAGGTGAVMDPYVSFDGEWVYFARLHELTEANPSPAAAGADIYRIHVATREVVRLTRQQFTPNLGAANWSSDFRTAEDGKDYLNYGVFNLGPCPLPGGRLAFVSNRNGFRPPRVPMPVPTLQLFVMDDDGRNVELIGHLNLGNALHPVVLRDGRILFSSFESQGLRSTDSWGIWSIHPDGTNWEPVVSAFETSGIGANNSFHFQTQISDGSLVVESYYINNNNGMGAYVKLPPRAPPGEPAFGPAWQASPKNPPLRFGRHYNGYPVELRLAFSPYGIESLTPFANQGEGVADTSVLGDESSPRVGKFTHPSGAPDNHLLTVWTAGPVNHQNQQHYPLPDTGLYLIKNGEPVAEPAQMVMIKNDPAYNEQWPRALVPYERIYGVREPENLPPLANDGSLSRHLPAGTPYGLVGASSLYKRESYPYGAVPEGKVTATFAGESDPTDGYRGQEPFNTAENGVSYNWTHQGADAGLYANSDIHAIRILAMEPTSDRSYQRGFYSHAQERLRILGEIPVRKFENGGSQPQDSDGNPDTSFLAKIPADIAWTFQTLDKDGMLLNMSQTWHQLRPGEIRNNCGGCHAHSQQPTLFEQTAAARPDYKIWDLTEKTPLVTSRERDESQRQWDADTKTGVRYAAGVVNVEYFRDIQPIFRRSCTACHTKSAGEPAGNLALDADLEQHEVNYLGTFPGTYYRLALDTEARFGHKPINDRYVGRQWHQENASRYIMKFQSRRSLLAWKLLGRRTDGFSNDDFPTETVPGDISTLALAGQPVEPTPENVNRADLDYTGLMMPPPESVTGDYRGPDGKSIRVSPLTDEDRRTIIRWIDLGCPIDLEYDAQQPDRPGFGWMGDDNRPTLTLAEPRAGKNPHLKRIRIGMHDYYSGLDIASLDVRADFQVEGAPPGTNLADRLQQAASGVWELTFRESIERLTEGTITVSIKDNQGNLSRIDRVFSVGGTGL